MRLPILIALLSLISTPTWAQRTTPMFHPASINGTWTHTQQGASIEKQNGKIPQVTLNGTKAWKINAQGNSGIWMMGIPRRNWSRMYLKSYLPDGYLQVRIKGESGGEALMLGIADTDRDGKSKPDKDLNAYVKLSNYTKITKQWQTIKIPIKDFVTVEPNLDLEDIIQVLVQGDGPVRPMTVYFADLAFKSDAKEPSYPAIKLNQLGYTPSMRKVARISKSGNGFTIVNLATDKTVYSGKLKLHARNDKASGDTVYIADFSSVTQEGRYRLVANGIGESAPFTIAKDIYDQVFVESMRFYYYQRCNTELPKRYAGKFARPATHPNDTKLTELNGGNKTHDMSGGWHDAGDHNKYACWVQDTVLTLLNLYEVQRSKITKATFALPESQNPIPDILDEIAWELDWTLKMQVKDGIQAGLVYDRVHPKKDKADPLRFVFAPTNQATSACISTWARASKTFATIPALKSKSTQYLSAAKKGFTALLKNNPKPEYVLNSALSLYHATGDKTYLPHAKKHMGIIKRPQEYIWGSYKFPVATLALAEDDADGLRDIARKHLIASADFYAQTWKKDGYGVPIWNTDHYCWSSSAFIGNIAQLALLANEIKPKQDYVDMAADVLHYYFGKNAVATSFVTGYGNTAGVSQLPSGEDKPVVYHGIHNAPPTGPNGMIGGGVNQWEPKGISAYAAKHYRPDPKAWTLNEVAIYYNAPLVFLSGYFATMDNPKDAAAAALQAAH